MTAPYRRLALRIFQGPGSAHASAVHRETLCPEEKAETWPSIFLPGQLDRVTATSEHLPLSAEIESIVAREYTHAPTYAYHISDAVLYRGSIYAGNLRYFITEPGRFGRMSDVEYFSQAGLASTAVGYRYFGHWLRDDCIQYVAASNYGPPLCVRLDLSPHMEQYASCFAQDWSGASQAIVDHLVLFQDHAQNSLKRFRYEQLSSRIAQVFPNNGVRNKLVYVRRGEAGQARLIENEDALVEALVQQGFEVLDVASDFSTIIRVLRAAKLVVSIEGSNINHFNFCAGPGCALIVLEPPDRFIAFHRHWAECVGVRFGFVVGTKRGEQYAFSAAEILKTADMALNEIR
ncbi:glycosyltransferase 61 family protein [Tardiphaga robiniae]|uniref:Glycosyltransferase family 61 protein n=1 Tax=Tardiphaga robiniae TaxID=943830 RepID=A0A7G6TUK0_9BRAD|nr:glycosyltransferase family 61 protein [Tardiphaga robiniae]QND70432.1 glycosyltransferase family 61 protein [Tardiphaga robiniae]